MRTVERLWRISLAVAFLTTAWTAPTPAADPLNSAATPPSRPVTATPSKPVPKRMGRAPTLRLASRLNGPARECDVWLCGHFPLILGVAF
jgi:hypothetical protein